MKVKKGDVVAVEYEGKFEDGTVFDKSNHGDHSHPLEFKVGSGMVVVGFDKAVEGMEKGEEKEITLNPEEGYGQRRDELKQKIPRNALPADQEPKKGMTLVIGTPQGQQVPVNILEVNDSEITIDLNHPLAGKVLIFKIKVVDINPEKGNQNNKEQ